MIGLLLLLILVTFIFGGEAALLLAIALLAFAVIAVTCQRISDWKDHHHAKSR